jgi:hypothetical protein
MRHSKQGMRYRPLAFVLAAAVAGCSSSGAQSSAPPTSPATAAPVSDAPATTAGARVIEDAGLETPMVAGVYTSRLFKPALTLKLGEGWFRREAGSARTVDRRRAPDGAAAVPFISRIDFLQCGTARVVAKPNARAIVDAIRSSKKLTSTAPVAVPVGSLSGFEIRIAGGGDPVPEAEFMKSNEYGCVLTIGDQPFPAEALWVMVTPDVVRQFVAVDVGQTTVLVRGLAVTETEAHFDLVLQLLANASLG